MEIKEVYNDFFQKESGIIIDDAYDLYKRNRYVQYINNKNITFIASQDNDLNYLKELPHIKYISIPRDVDCIDGIYFLERLKGIEFIVVHILKSIFLNSRIWKK